MASSVKTSLSCQSSDSVAPRLNFSIDESDGCAGHPMDHVPTTEKRGQITG